MPLSPARQREIINTVHHKLIDGHVLSTDDGTQLRWCYRKQPFDSGDYTITPLETGFYVCYPDSDRWLFHGQIDTIADRMLTPQMNLENNIEAEGWFVGFLGSIVLNSMRKDRK